MSIDRAAKMTGQHLGTQADAEKGGVLLQAGPDPVDLRLDEIVGIIGTAEVPLPEAVAAERFAQ